MVVYSYAFFSDFKYICLLKKIYASLIITSNARLENVPTFFELVKYSNPEFMNSSAKYSKYSKHYKELQNQIPGKDIASCWNQIRLIIWYDKSKQTKHLYEILFRILSHCFGGIFCTFQGLIQDLNMGGHLNVSTRWTITNIKKYCR